MNPVGKDHVELAQRPQKFADLLQRIGCRTGQETGLMI
jgi:hypothetical protein